jgi:hypothetical protein
VDRDFLRFKDFEHPDMGKTFSRARSQDKSDLGRFGRRREGRGRLNLPVGAGGQNHHDQACPKPFRSGGHIRPPDRLLSFDLLPQGAKPRSSSRAFGATVLKPRRGAPLFFLPYFQKTESVCQFISGIVLPLPRGNGQLMGHFLITAILLFKKNQKWDKIHLSGIEIAKKSQWF